MKRFLISTTFVLAFAGMALAKGPGSGSGSGDGSGNGSGRSVTRAFTGNNVTKLSSSQFQTTKKTTGISLGQNQVTKKSNGINLGQSQVARKIQGNSNVRNLQGFRTSMVQHQQFCGRYNVPFQCRQHCFFHHDFCYNHYCWHPTYNCCCYYHPYQCCWFYWNPTYCCYLPIQYVQQYAPTEVVSPVPEVGYAPSPMNINVNNNGNANGNGIDSVPALPAGAVANLPQGVNPMMPLAR